MSLNRLSKNIVADAGPLIAFARINQLDLITKLFTTIIIPKTVADECLSEIARPGAIVIQQNIEQKNISLMPDPTISPLDNSLDFLGPGETAAIKLAAQNKSPLLIDEKLGRAAAKKLQLKIIGTAGILLLAKEHQYIKKVRPLIEQLITGLPRS